MEMVSRAKRSRIADEEEEHDEDHISRLPDAVLGEIVTLLGTKDGGCTQAIASRWRHIWRSAPLNVDLHDRPPYFQCHYGNPTPIQGRIPLAQISGTLSSHQGPGRRFSIPSKYFKHDADPVATLDGWLWCPALDGIQDLDFHYGCTWYPCQDKPPVPRPPLPLPESARRFSSTLHAASFGGCVLPDENGLHLPHLIQLSLMSIKISETSLYALLAGCPLLQSLMLTESIGCIKRLRIVSQTLRSIGVCVCGGDILIDQLIIEDAPSLERFLLLGDSFSTQLVISVISAPKLKILGQLQRLQGPTLEFGNSLFKGSSVLNSSTVVPSVKVLALTHITVNLDEVIAFLKCFPCLENLYVKILTVGTKSRVTNAWRQKYRDLVGTLDIRLKKIVLSTYLGNRAHVNFASFFVLNAGVLESMVLELNVNRSHDKAWLQDQKRLLQMKRRASRGAQFDFVKHYGQPIPSEHMWYEQTHDLSTADPFVWFNMTTVPPIEISRT